jgi:hypothetical protein
VMHLAIALVTYTLLVHLAPVQSGHPVRAPEGPKRPEGPDTAAQDDRVVPE